MAIDDEGPSAEGFETPFVILDVPPEIGLPALPQSIDVRDNDEVGQLVIGRLVDGFPDRTLGQLAVTAEDPYPEGKVLEVLARKRYSHAVG